MEAGIFREMRVICTLEKGAQMVSKTWDVLAIGPLVGHVRYE
jgi:hypothetical protein